MAAHALVIDDNLLNIEVLCMMLAHEGLSSTTLTRPQQLNETLARLFEQSTRVDVAFVDLEFPNGDGFNVLRQLKADPHFVGVPIVAYTVHTSEIDIARQSGFDSFLGKPLDSRYFPQQLRQILAHQPVWVG
jgi:CheY-like chemotaxis protein